jgi:hypothetical protein
MSTVIIGGGGEAKKAIDDMVAKSIHATPTARAAMEAFLTYIATNARYISLLVDTLKPSP